MGNIFVMSFKIIHKSIFDTNVDAYVNSINCVSTMGTGIALEFKKRYPKMFEDYKEQCSKHLIRPGDCYIYHENDLYLLGLAVKDDWRHWSSKEWIEMCLKSLKLAILENDIKSVNIPLIGGFNGNKGPYGKILGMTPPPNREELKKLIENELSPFSNKFNIDINLCIPDEVPKKPQMTLESFL